MNIARCRGFDAFVKLRSVSLAPRFTSIRTISSSNTALKTKKKSESIDFEDLPKTKRDLAGTPVKPLEPLVEYKKPHHAPSVDIASGDIPDTALAKQVYLNWKRFPDCVVLTRVGRFYEVSVVMTGHMSADGVVLLRSRHPLIVPTQSETSESKVLWRNLAILWIPNNAPR